MRFLSLTALVLFAVAGAVRSEEACCQAILKATQDKVANLITGWKGVSAKMAAMCPDEKSKLTSAFAEVAKTCPIGSRMGDTMGFIRDALALSISADAECAKANQEAAAKKDGVATASKDAVCCEKLAGVMETRAKLSKDLHTLVSNVIGVMSGECEKACPASAGAATAAKDAGYCPQKAGEVVAAVRASDCCEKSKELILAAIPELKCADAASKLAATIKGAACEKEAADLFISAANACKKEACAKDGKEVAKKDASSDLLIGAKTGTAVAGSACCDAKAACADKAGCSVALGKKSKELLASWDKARAELIAFTPAQKQELHVKGAAMMEKHPAMTIMPQTIQALAEGIDTLAAMNATLQKAVDADESLKKSIPEEKMKAFKANAELIQQTSEILKKMGGAFQAFAPAEAAKENAKA